MPGIALRQVSKGTVIEATAHTEAIASIIEGNQRRDDQIQAVHLTRLAPVTYRFGDTEAIKHQLRFLGKRREPEAVVVAWTEGRQVAMLTHLQGAPDQWGQIDFTVVGQIESDVTAVQEQWLGGEIAFQGDGGTVVLLRAKAAALMA